jgi:prophage antirepressor-like protein
MTNLVHFSFESHEIRTLSVDGNPYFVAKDVAEVLEYSWK